MPAARGQEPQLRPGRGAGEASPKAPRGPRGSASFLHPWAGGCGCSGTAGGCAPTQVGRGWGSGPLRQVLPTRMWPSTRGQTLDKHSHVPGPAPRAPGCGGRSGGLASPPGVLRGAGEGPARHPGCGPPKAWEGWPSTAGAPGGGRWQPLPQRDLGVEGRCCSRVPSEAKQVFHLLLLSREESPELAPSKGHTGRPAVLTVEGALQRPGQTPRRASDPPKPGLPGRGPWFSVLPGNPRN